MSQKKCLPLTLKLNLLADYDKGYRPKALMKKYKVKKSSYYRILSEKEELRNYPVKLEPKCEIQTDDDNDDYSENSSNNRKIHENNQDGSEDESPSDTGHTLEGVNQAVMQWYDKQEAAGVAVSNVDIDGAAEKLAQELGFTDFKLNSSGWPLRFRKPQEAGKTTIIENLSDDESPEPKSKKVLRIQDQITAFQRLQAGESADQIADDLGVSKATILSVKKKLKDTLFTPSLDSKYTIKVESLKTRNQNENNIQENSGSFAKSDGETMANDTLELDGDKESVWAAIERRKQLKCDNYNGMSRKDKGLTYNEKIEAIAQYKSGITLKQIARNFCVSTSTIQRVKKKFSKSHKLAYKNYMKLEEKVNVIERLDEGETIAEIAEDLKLNDSTIRAIKKNRIKIMNVYKVSLSTISVAPGTSKKMNMKERIENKLVDWIKDLKRRKIPINSAMILKKALMIQMNLSQGKGGSSSHNFTFTKDWLSNFKRQHNIEEYVYEETESPSESEQEMYWKAAPKSKKKFGPVSKSTTHHTALSSAEGMTLSKFAEGLREMYLDSSLPANPERCNSFTPRVILTRQEQEQVEKINIIDAIKNEPVSDEETWLTAHTNAYSDSDWEEENGSAHSVTEIQKSKDNMWKKRKKTSTEYSRKRRRLSNGEESDDRSGADYNKSSYLNVPIKQEPLEGRESLDSIPSNVPMAVLPAGSTYVPPLPMFQMPTTGLTVYMPESQQMMMQHPINYPHGNSSDMFMNQQQIRGRTIGNSHPCQFSDIQDEASVEPNIRQENENVIVMPFGGDLSEQEKSKDMSLSNSDSAVRNSLAEKARKDRAAAIAESIGISLEGSSHKKLRDLTFRLLELNNKNLICDERLDNAREEYEKTVAHIKTEKSMNDKEIDKVLAAIQEWKETKGQPGT